MTDETDSIRQRSMVALSDPDLRVYLASVEDLVRIYDDARANRWTARWSSEDALRRQVKPGTTAILCPLLRNGGPQSRPESYRCYVSFMLNSADESCLVSLIDIGKEMLATIPEAADPIQLKRVVRILIEGASLDKIL